MPSGILGFAASCGSRKSLRAFASPRLFRPLRQFSLALSATGSARLHCPKQALLPSELHPDNKYSNSKTTSAVWSQKTVFNFCIIIYCFKKIKCFFKKTGCFEKYETTRLIFNSYYVVSAINTNLFP